MMQGDNTLSAAGFYNSMLGGGESVSVGGGGGGGGGTWPFELENGTVKNCWLLFGRRLVSCQDTEIAAASPENPPSGTIYAHVRHPDSGDGTLELRVAHGGDLPENSATDTFRGLYVAKDGVWTDLRFMPTVQAMD